MKDNRVTSKTLRDQLELLATWLGILLVVVFGGIAVWGVVLFFVD